MKRALFKIAKGYLLISMFALFGQTACAGNEKPIKKGETKMSIYEFKVAKSNGDIVSMGDYKGKTLMIVNVASKCGFTPQYAKLQALYEKYKDKNFIILGFPCNQFLGQEPGTDEEIQKFCQLNYGVTFPVFKKIKVNGKEADPLYQFLKSQIGKNAIKWNFCKFIVTKEGDVVERYVSGDPFEQIEKDLLKHL
jgi:glutathione peroxidase